MMTTAPRTEHDHTPAAVLWMACELRDNTWTLGFSLGHGQKPRARRLPAHAQQRWLDEIAHAKARLGLPNTAPGASCDAAGREGVWLHRWLQAQDLTPQVVAASSIAVPRRQRRAKSDALDVRKWLRRLRR
jgi:transposase